MASDPAFLFYPGDYLKDTQCLSEETQVAYDRIMCEHMRNICITQDRLNFFTKRLNAEQKKEILSVLTKIEGGYEITWVAESLLKRRNYSDSRRKNREGKTTVKAEHMNNISKSYVPHMENEIENEDINTITVAINTFLKRKSQNTMEVRSMVQQWVKAGYKDIQGQIAAMKACYQRQNLVFPMRIDTLTKSFQDSADWKDKLKDLDPERIADNIQQQKNGKRKESIDDIGTSAPGSLG